MTGDRSASPGMTEATTGQAESSATGTQSARAIDVEEQKRLNDARELGVPWKKWGPYLSERHWGTVREDDSENGDAWGYFSHDRPGRAPTAGARTAWAASRTTASSSDLMNLYAFYGDDFTVEFPTGSGQRMTLFEVAREISGRLAAIVLRDGSGRRPVHGGSGLFQDDPH